MSSPEVQSPDHSHSVTYQMLQHVSVGRVPFWTSNCLLIALLKIFAHEYLKL